MGLKLRSQCYIYYFRTVNYILVGLKTVWSRDFDTIRGDGFSELGLTLVLPTPLFKTASYPTNFFPEPLPERSTLDRNLETFLLQDGCENSV